MALKSWIGRRLFGWWRRSSRVTVVRLTGVIGGGGPGRPGLTLHGVAAQLEQAFEPSRLAAVALVINSPGGSPVQSALIARRIRELADEKKVPVLAFVEDVAASGGYWLASAADEIFADHNSIIGSIGVISAGFGFQELIARHGIERRVHTTGARKMMLDPFRPEQPEDVGRLMAIQAEVHDSFKEMVRLRRGDRLRDQGGEDGLFSGEVWLGRRALELGLIDGLGELGAVVRARFGKRVELCEIEEERGWLARKLSFGAVAAARRRDSEAGPAGVIGAVLAAIEERSWWARYGL
ncbi:MAG: S49 family peptidase [Rhodospirillaceae bacterium]